MKNTLHIAIITSIILNICFFVNVNLENKNKKVSFPRCANSEIIDTNKIVGFFEHHPEYNEFKSDVRKLYYKNNHLIWHDKDVITKFASMLFKSANQLNDEGLPQYIPYKEELDQVFYGNSKNMTDAELLISSLYFYYIKKVYSGISKEKRMRTGWFLTKEKEIYSTGIDTLLFNPELKKKEMTELFSQYYSLRNGLKKYKTIAEKGGWQKIDAIKDKSIKFGTISTLITQVRTRLATEGYLIGDSGKNEFDDDLLNGISNYQMHHNLKYDSLITNKLITSLNVSVENRIKSISVNMERCRWVDISPVDYIAINIPSYKLFYFKGNDLFFISKVVVGKELNKTVVFKGEINQIIFNPYWNVPQSILVKEIMPAINKNPNYLLQHHMEWHNGKVRQKPGKDNSLGLVKFIFPNSNNIYLHDTPQKSLFNQEKRAFSHGCIRVEKACELATIIMESDYGWTELQTISAMNSGKEKGYLLRRKIPVYIAYFTAWADLQGQVSFYEDIYQRDALLANMIF
ncbi:L,D-transpeptidase family protein [Flavobacterium sp.]|uniref:L,D-transpeptidase family protein n=1 Tax=Flavobacterium sp. TaxID=239 RepID=UPI003D6A6353